MVICRAPGSGDSFSGAQAHAAVLSDSKSLRVRSSGLTRSAILSEIPDNAAAAKRTRKEHSMNPHARCILASLMLAVCYGGVAGCGRPFPLDFPDKLEASDPDRFAQRRDPRKPWVVAQGEAPRESCDDPFPALIVTATDATGNTVVPDRVEIFSGARSLLVLSCGDYECVSSDLEAGTYRVVATLGNQRLERQAVSVENSYACSHEVTRLRFSFQAPGDRPVLNRPPYGRHDASWKRCGVSGLAETTKRCDPALMGHW